MSSRHLIDATAEDVGVVVVAPSAHVRRREATSGAMKRAVPHSVVSSYSDPVMSRGPRDESRSPAAARASFADKGSARATSRGRRPSTTATTTARPAGSRRPMAVEPRPRRVQITRPIPKSPNLIRRHLHTQEVGRFEVAVDGDVWLSAVQVRDGAAPCPGRTPTSCAHARPLLGHGLRERGRSRRAPAPTRARRGPSFVLSRRLRAMFGMVRVWATRLDLQLAGTC